MLDIVWYTPASHLVKFRGVGRYYISILKEYCTWLLFFFGVLHRSVLFCLLFFDNDIHRGVEHKALYYCEWILTKKKKELYCLRDESVLFSIYDVLFCFSFKKKNLFKASLTYAEAQMRIDSAAMNDDITVSLRGLNKLAKILKKKRIDNG